MFIGLEDVQILKIFKTSIKPFRSRWHLRAVLIDVCTHTCNRIESFTLLLLTSRRIDKKYISMNWEHLSSSRKVNYIDIYKCVFSISMREKSFMFFSDSVKKSESKNVQTLVFMLRV